MTNKLLCRYLLFTLFFSAACGPKELPYTDNSQDPDAYARDVKTLVVNSARQARSSSEPLDLLTLVLSELKKSDRPVGKFRPTYDELRNSVEILVAEFERLGKRPANFAERLDELIKMAQALPGDSPKS